MRTFDEGVRTRALAAIERIINAEAAASGAPKPPEITPIDRYFFVSNDPAATRRWLAAFSASFPADRIRETGPTSASGDFGSFGVQWHAPSVIWFVGGSDPDVYRTAKESGRVSELPTNRNPRFAPVLHPTLEAGAATLVVASQAWLAGPAAKR